MKRRASIPAHARSVAWLGGTALFGLLACQPPGAGSGTTPEGDSITVRPDPIGREVAGQSKDTVIARANPEPGMEGMHTIPAAEGGSCVGNFMETQHCDGKGQIWHCWTGEWRKGGLPGYSCAPGQIRPVYTTFGFNGIDKSGRKPLRASRRARAVA